MTNCNIRLQTLYQAQTVSLYLSQLFPKPEQTMLGINELLLNAIEHGNLGISYAEKTQMQKENTWLAEIERRLTLPEYQDKWVDVSYEYLADQQQIMLTIRDAGQGFDWRTQYNNLQNHNTSTHGRGMLMAKNFSFDEMYYSDPGNIVVCICYLARKT
jgi:anti-sigma regulatory factor (Ser/Thr protein kinase)